MRRDGFAVLWALFFATLLLMMAISYTKLVQGGNRQTELVDEQSKVDFLAEGVIDKAILKFQLFPGDFYAAWEAYTITGQASYVSNFYDESSLEIENSIAKSSFNDFSVKAKVSSMTMLTNPNWNSEAIRFEATVTYNDRYGKGKTKTITKIFSMKRETVTP